ncbi:MAG: bifunctional UDP-N-acetylglucosamine diphosphorylase/glucosamine-1-phosphate N-acetyltransferase GlmU [Acidimicrobiia bacterium]
MTVNAIVLAAGKGTRMNSGRAKVLHEAAGLPLVGWMHRIATGAGASQVVVVVGHQADDVAAVLPDGTVTALQTEQLGTGHAAGIGLERIDPCDVVVVLPGDMPLIRPETIAGLVDTHLRGGDAATVLSVELDEPTGYGRVVRDHQGGVVAIVEHGDATAEQRKIAEVNTAVYAFDPGLLDRALAGVGSRNAQGERYLTDVIGVLVAGGHTVGAMVADAAEGAGVNSHEQLAAASAELRRRINTGWMEAGVFIEDPCRVSIAVSVTLSPDVRLWGDVHLAGATSVASGAQLGPSVHISDTTVAEGARVWYAVVRGASIGRNAEVGPFVSLRQGTVLDEASKAGTFVEIKGSVVGPGSKVPHLSYVGDATIGAGSNIGAGTITANYDGYRKHRTVIGDGVRIGSDTVLVAPVEVGDGAWTGAGSVITSDVSPDSLAVTRSQQREVPGYAQRRKARADEEQG